jgi:hypothetical protein
MTADELTDEQRAELEHWASEMAARFEHGIDATPGTPLPPLMELRRLRYQRRRIDEAMPGLVQAARQEGDSWHKIGLALGTTGEAARQRFHAVV